MNITHHIERGAQLFPDKVALIFEDKAFTYKELDQAANRMTNGLQGLGIRTGNRVALFLPNIPEFIISYLGILKFGAIAVSLNAMLKKSEVKFILNDCAARVVITTEELCKHLPEADCPHLYAVLIAKGNTHRENQLAQLMVNASSKARAMDMDRDAAAAILYTSGTTGFPKGVTLSHGNVISNMYSQNRSCRMCPEDRLLLCVPLFHCFGQNAILNAGLNACATIILQRRFKPEKVLEAISNTKTTMFFGVPTIFVTFLNMNVADYDLSSVRLYFSAAAPLPVELSQRWHQQHGRVIHEGYGLTETSPCACYNHDLKYKLGSIGSPIENVEMKIVNADGQEVLPGELGEIVIRGPNVMLGYWNRPFETAKVIKSGWLHTGDIGRMDEDGYFYIVDRLKDMINVSGFKVYPRAVENVVYQHPAVAEVAVCGVPNPIKGEIVQANVVPKRGKCITERAYLILL